MPTCPIPSLSSFLWVIPDNVPRLSEILVSIPNARIKSPKSARKGVVGCQNRSNSSILSTRSPHRVKKLSEKNTRDGGSAIEWLADYSLPPKRSQAEGSVSSGKKARNSNFFLEGGCPFPFKKKTSRKKEEGEKVMTISSDQKILLYKSI